MVEINKKEKEAILSRFPDLCIVRTMKHDSKRHHYYCEERKSAMRFLKELRNSDIDIGAKGGDVGVFGKKTKRI